MRVAEDQSGFVAENEQGIFFAISGKEQARIRGRTGKLFDGHFRR
jgi:hypothetical protein